MQDMQLLIQKLPHQEIIKLLNEDDLHVTSEYQVLDFVKEYILYRDQLMIDTEKLQPAQEVQSEVIKPKDLHEKAKLRLTLKKLLPEEVKEILRTVRYAFLTHDELLKAVQQPIFSSAKDWIIEALSAKLKNFEVQATQEYSIPLNPRKHYTNQQIVRLSQRDLIQASQQMSQQIESPEILSEQEQKSETFDRDENFEIENQQNQYPSQRYQHYQFQPDKQTKQQQLRTHQAQPLQTQKALIKQLQEDQSLRNSYEPKQRKVEQLDLQSIQKNAQALYQTTPTRQQQKEVYSKGVRPPQELPTFQKEFAYSYDFDENGALFYLGTNGNTRSWQNPHTVKQVTVFCSSLGQGRLEDLVSRTITNLRTCNEENAYIGVDLGGGRGIQPTCYTLRNRNSNSHFEGSNDKIQWKILDRRIHITGDSELDQQLESDRRTLCIRGTSSTWAVSQSSIQGQGFRYLRIVQIGKNSSGSDNLSLSGLEIYGKIISGRWP